jgi:hypothetical protein
MSNSADGHINISSLVPAAVTPLELSSAACSALSSPGTPEPLDNSGKQRAMELQPLELQPYGSPPQRPQSVPVSLDLQGVTPTSSAATTTRSRGSADSNTVTAVITTQSTPRSPEEKRARRQKILKRMEQMHQELSSLHRQLAELC